jgi:threonine/homoserine/homoserine lactone efflux protein
MIGGGYLSPHVSTAWGRHWLGRGRQPWASAHAGGHRDPARRVGARAAVATGPLLADGPIVLLAAGVLGQVPQGFVPAISLVGGAFLLYLAVTTGVNARRAVVPRGQPVSARGGLLTGLLARLLGPNPYLFWFLVGGPALIQARQAGWLPVAAFLVAYYTTIVGSNVGLAVVVHRSVGLLSDRVYRGLLLFSSLLLAVYALVLIGRGPQAVRLERGPGQ